MIFRTSPNSEDLILQMFSQVPLMQLDQCLRTIDLSQLPHHIAAETKV